MELESSCLYYPPRAKNTTLILQCSIGDGVIRIGVMSKPGTANDDEDFIRIKGSLKRHIPLNLLFGAVLDTVYIPKSIVGAATNDKLADPLNCNDDTRSESGLHTADGVLRSRIQPRGHHKKIVISFDEIKTRSTGEITGSHVAKIHRMLERNENDQVCFYRSWTLKTTLQEIIMDGYKFLVEHYKRGDIISFFGYSKGGYAAHLLSRLIHYVGILVPGHDYLIPEVWRIFHRIISSKKPWKYLVTEFFTLQAFSDSFVRSASRVRFFGVFDAINPYLSKNGAFEVDSLPSQIMRHALSIDEQQVLLQPANFGSNESDRDEDDVQQVWFPGGHQVIRPHV